MTDFQLGILIVNIYVAIQFRDERKASLLVASLFFVGGMLSKILG
jgi:hypothetical protein